MALVALFRQAMFRHPVATQAAVRALIAEGERQLQTDEGADLARRLSGSPLVSRLRAVWDLTTANTFDDAEGPILPTALVEAIAHLAAHGHPEERLGDAMRRSR